MRKRMFLGAEKLLLKEPARLKSSKPRCRKAKLIILKKRLHAS
jgi:hypothetical protein